MGIDVQFTAAAAAAAGIRHRAVVIDVLRATTTIAWALAGGAAAVWPAARVEEARQLAERLRRELAAPVLLAGERDNVPPAGFDLGNSPAALRERDLDGHHLVLTTSNGTRAIAAVEAAQQVYAVSLPNLDAVAAALKRDGSHVTMVCAGTNLGRDFSLEDTVCAGALIQRLLTHLRAHGLAEPELSDRARFSLDAAAGGSADWEVRLGQARHGRRLLQEGYEDDVRLAARPDTLQVVPALQQGRLVDVGAAR